MGLMFYHALKRCGVDTEMVIYPDEGHGFQRPVNSMALWAASEKFFAKHIAGRVQEDMTPEVGARLKEISVDPKSVVLTKKADASAVGVPKLVGTLAAGSASYQAKIEVNGQTIPMPVTRVIKEENGAWVVNETAQTPMGPVTDTTVLDRATLVPRKRSVKQGPVSVELAFEGGKATGTMAMGAEPKPVSVDLGGELFADGAGANDVLAQLPLAEKKLQIVPIFSDEICMIVSPGDALAEP